MLNPLLEFQLLQKVKERIRDIQAELNLLDGRSSPEDYNLRASLSAEMRKLRAQLANTRVKVV